MFNGYSSCYRYESPDGDYNGFASNSPFNLLMIAGLVPDDATVITAIHYSNLSVSAGAVSDEDYNGSANIPPFESRQGFHACSIGNALLLKPEPH